MHNVLFPQSELADPYSLYARMLDESPIHFDRKNEIWAVYRYQDCQSILHSDKALIPPLPAPQPVLLNEQAQTVLANLIRLSNPPFHDLARPIAYQLFGKLEVANIGHLFDYLLGLHRNASSIDWVEAVAKKLPALSVLTGLGFSENESVKIFPLVPDLVKLMAPIKTPNLAKSINRAVQIVYPIVERHLAHNGVVSLIPDTNLDTNRESCFTQAELLDILVANCIGFMIQSYDAGRGLLSNVLIELMRQDYGAGMGVADVNAIRPFVVETLRYDPSVQNTKRLLIEDMEFGDTTIRAGENVLLVLAAANRDPQHFERPNEFNPHRANNDEHLTFGAGAHRCFAKEYSTHLTATILACLFEKFSSVQLAEEDVQYEPMSNVRLPVRLMLALTP